MVRDDDVDGPNQTGEVEDLLEELESSTKQVRILDPERSRDLESAYERLNRERS